MNNTGLVLALLLLGVSTPHVFAALTMDQMRNAAKMIRNVCQPKTGVATELIDQISEGVFDEENRDLKCYIKCAMQMMQSMGSNGKLRPDAAISQAKKMLPIEIRDAMIAGIDTCRNVDKENPGLDPCDLALVATKCVYNHTKDVFLFP
uniref:Chemosensory protein n=1 Tax=Blattella germanica TaxID=6973 RepID=A0A0X8DC64_BLAGE|nr:chemosensory protein [Blattella germanica]